jgi:hypothetical protein
MVGKSIIESLLKNSSRNKHKPEPDPHVKATPDPTPLHYEEAQVQSDLPMVDSDLEAIKKPYGL